MSPLLLLLVDLHSTPRLIFIGTRSSSSCFYSLFLLLPRADADAAAEKLAAAKLDDKDKPADASAAPAAPSFDQSIMALEKKSLTRAEFRKWACALLVGGDGRASITKPFFFFTCACFGDAPNEYSCKQ